MKTEDYRRPNHADFQTSSELAKAKFSGSRHNSITDDIEFWILGNLEVKVPASARQLDPRAVEKAMESHFMLKQVEFENKERKNEQ